MYKFLTLYLLIFVYYCPLLLHSMQEEEPNVSYKRKIIKDISYYENDIVVECAVKQNISLDLSDNPFLTSSEVLDLLQKININNIKFINLSNTSIDEDFFEDLQDRNISNSLPFLNICNTPIGDKILNNKIKQNLGKIIFIPKELLEYLKKGDFDSDIIKLHQKYYALPEQIIEDKKNADIGDSSTVYKKTTKKSGDFSSDETIEKKYNAQIHTDNSSDELEKLEKKVKTDQQK